MSKVRRQKTSSHGFPVGMHSCLCCHNEAAQLEHSTSLARTGSISTTENVLKLIEVHCRCEAVELRITGEPVAQIYCHCDDCQAAHGAAYVLVAVYPAQAVEVIKGTPSPDGS